MEHKFNNNLFEDFPNEIIFNIALNIPLCNIINFCLINKRFNEIICNENYFWKQKFIKDFGDATFEVSDWKTLYMNANDVWLLVYHDVSRQQNINMTIKNINNIFANVKQNSKILNSQQITQFVDLPKQKIRYRDMSHHENRLLVIDTNNNVQIIGDRSCHRPTINGNKFQYIPLIISNLKAKKVVSSPWGDEIFIDIDDNVWVTGFAAKNWDFSENMYGQYDVDLAVAKKINIKAKEISIGISHIAIIDLNDDIWIQGIDEPDPSYYNEPDGLLGLGPNVAFSELQIISGFKAKKIVCGYRCTAFIDINNDIWVFGNNEYGQLGLGDFNNRSLPTKIEGLKGKEISMFQHTVVIDLQGKMWKFGWDGIKPKRSVPIMIGKDVRWKNININENGIVATDEDCNVWITGKWEDGYRCELTMIPNFKAFRICSGGFVGAKI